MGVENYVVLKSWTQKKMSQKILCKTKTQIEDMNLQTRYSLTTTKGPTLKEIKSSVLKWREKKKKNFNKYTLQGFWHKLYMKSRWR